MSEIFEHEIRVGWGDCDPAQIAYTGNIPRWALATIDAWWEAQLGGGWYHMELDLGFGLPFVHMTMDFTAPITPRHRLICRAWPLAIGGASVTFRVIGLQDGVQCFTGRFVSVFTRAGVMRASPSPDEVRALVEGLIRPDIPEPGAG